MKKKQKKKPAGAAKHAATEKESGKKIEEKPKAVEAAEKKAAKAVKKAEPRKGEKPGEAQAPREEMRREHEPAEQAVINIGMVGHVDHGKTSLTQALTGKWTDTHSEELKRGISIRLGYADATFYRCRHCKGSIAYTNKAVCANCGKHAEKLRRVSFVDAPGHETLMTTMLSGAALMQGAILVIAANEQCPQPQTLEHLIALRIVGIKHLVVAQNKIDLVEREQAMQNMKQISELLEKNGYSNIPIIPIAVHFGTNLDLLIEAIETYIPTPSYELNKPLKMYCARSFDINKPGAKPNELKGGVFGGTIVHGKVKIGDRVEVSPGIENGKRLETTVVSLSTAAGRLKEAAPGGLIAIGTLLDPSLTQNDKMKGRIVAMPGSLPEPITELAFEVNFIERLVADVEKQIKTNETIVLTIGTMTAAATATKSAGGKISARCGAPVVVEKGQNIAISKKDSGRWRLVGYAAAQ